MICQTSAKAQQKAKEYFSGKDEYELELLKAQIDLLSVQQEVARKKRKLIVVLEGVDTAGKGGLVRRMSQHLDPRMFHVYGIGKPTNEELAQHYMQRFFARLPNAGEICVFDRSWYGRVLVERVEGLATQKQWQRAYGEINGLEKLLHDDGFLVLKYLLDLSYPEQGRRFKERENDPLKSWKMTEDDYRNRSKWTPYQIAFRDMKRRTSTLHSPWTVVPADSKWFARVSILKDITTRARRHLKFS